jgi:hypothetical protein
MPSVGINSVWVRIQNHSGEEFRMIRGGEFRYEVVEGHVVLDRTPQRIPKSQFGKALARVPFPNTACVQDLRGPSFIYAILMDSRIRLNDW